MADGSRVVLIVWRARCKADFRGRDFEDWVLAEETEEPQHSRRQAIRSLAVAKMVKIIKGEYQYNGESEKIYFAENESANH